MSIDGNDSNNTLTGTLGDDVINGFSGNDTINVTQGADVIDGGTGTDRATINMRDTSRFASYAGARTYTLTNSSLTDSAGILHSSITSIERITFSTFGTGDYNDTIDASGFTAGGFFVVSITAGNGNNTIIGSSGSDNIWAGFGNNTIDAGAGNDQVTTNFDNRSGHTQFLTGSGETVFTTVDGTVTNAVTGAETIFVGGSYAGQNQYATDGLTSTIDGSGLGLLSGVTIYYQDHDGNDVFIGSANSEVFSNTSGFTFGDDTYRGNGGADIYDYTVAIDALNHDVILDFDADDIIDFQFNNGIIAGQLLCDQWLGAGNFTGVAGQYHYRAVGGQTLIEIDTDGDAIADRTLTIANGQFALGETTPGSNQLHIIGNSGTDEADFLVGSMGDDVYYAQGGDDMIAATQGTDFVDGGAGWDQLRFRTDLADRFTLPTGPLTYTITDGHVGDSSGTIDTSFTNIESVFLRTLGNGDYGDTVDASALTSAGLVLRLGTGNDTVIGGAGDDDIGMALGINSADAGAGNDVVYSAFDNTLGKTAYITSSGGTVLATVDGTVVASIVNAEQVAITGYYASSVTTVIDASGYDAIPGVQLVLRDSNGSDVLIGSHGADILSNVSGNTLGSDTFTGNGGADIFDWSYASDDINGDVITDLDGDDTLDFRFNNGNVEGASPLLCNLFIGGSQFTGHAGEYRYVVSGNTTLIQVDTNGDAVADQTMTIANGAFALGETFAGSNILHIIGSSGTNGVDTLTGTLGDDSIYALGSNDTINGSQGTDFVNGGNGGGDRLFMNTGDASLFTLATSARTYTIGASTIADSSGTLNTTFTAVERIAFSTVGNGNYNDTIDASGFVSPSGSPLDIRLGDGNNNVAGSSGNDRIFTGFGSNVINGGGGNDIGVVNVDASSAITVTITNVGGTLVTNANGAINQINNVEEVQVMGFGTGAVTLDASGYSNIPGVALILVGHDGTDIMIGSAGNDFFANTTGQVLGNDVYTGNGGADIYDYTYAADSMNGDTITDFDIDDVIDLRFNNLELGGSPLLANHFIGDAAFSGAAGEYRYQINGTTTIVQVDSNGDTVVDQTLTISNGGFALAETSVGSNLLTLAAVINPLDGVVADGYIAGATLFVDVNGNGVRDSGEAWTTTDAAGNFTLNVNQAGTIVAIGGVNADTGLANTMTLMAPSDSGVVNPLTTLVQAVIEASGGATSADAATDQVLASLGLDPGLDLLNLDLLAQGSDPAALEAQKAAAMIANLVSAAEGTAGAGANTESVLVGALADLVTDTAPGATVDLTDAATLTPLLTQALPGVTNVSTIANEVAAESETIAAATSIDGISDAQLDAALIDYSLDNVLTGDAGANHLFGFGGNDTLSGLGGNDILEGGSGFDFLWGGGGNDIFVAENSSLKVQTKVGALSMDVIFDFARGDKIDLRNIDANAALAGQQVFNFKGTGANKIAADLSYKVYDSVMGAEKALGHDIDGVAGASHFSGPVTIVYGNIDGGNPDFAIALIGVNGVSASDFLFA